MQTFIFILKTFRMIYGHKPKKLLLIFFLNLLIGATSGFSLVLLIPLLQMLSPGGGEGQGALVMYIREFAVKAGINLTIESVLLIYLVLLSFSALLQYGESILNARYQQTFIYGIRRHLFRKILMADWQVINRRSKTNHLQVLTKEVPNLAYYFNYYLRLLTTIITMTAYLAYALLISAGYTLIIAATGIALFIILRKFLFRSLTLGHGYVDSYNRLLKYIDDFWQTVKIAKVHRSEDFYYDRFDEASTSLLDLEYRMQRNWSLPGLIQRITGIVILAFVVYLGYRSAGVPITSFIILILLFSRIFPQFIAVNADLNVIISNVASVRLVMQLDADLPEPGYQTFTSRQAVKPGKEIRLEGISFSYSDGERLFHDFSATIKANSITGIVGQSGRGKTTLIDLIAGLQKPDSGGIIIDGVRLDSELLPGWQAGLGYLPQDPFFIDGTIRENLIWDSNGQASDDEIWRILRQVNAGHLVERFSKGLDAFIANYSFSFSGGECQRLALARVLLRKPALLLLDEATSSLDHENETAIMDVLASLKKDVTIIFVTHRESVAKWFDAVIKL